MFLDQKLTEQLRMGQQYITSFKTSGRRKKLNLAELKEGAVVKGRVTNITKFGVFVDINAVCDGLIHISQLADDYIETPDQVVKLDDEVDVRIMKVDKKKRRISLSMKKLGDKAPKIRPSHGQLTNLADHFKNR
jgi:ribosomal protein S1